MDQYDRLRNLGNGAYGIAWLVRQKEHQHGPLRVLKEIDLARVPDAIKSEAHEEANVLRSLSHINVIAYYSTFMESSKLCIVMEFADGGDLAAVVRQRKKETRRFLEDEALPIMMQCCFALQHVHKMHILHRDLKCQNIFLTKDNIVKLGDFGIARVLDCTSAEVNTVIGTPNYLPPEVVDNRPYGITADIWSLGIVFYELLVLEPPFQANCLAALVVKIATADPEPIPTDLYSEELRHIVTSCLQKNPEMRPRTKGLLAMSPFCDRRDLLPLPVQQNVQLRSGLLKLAEACGSSSRKADAAISHRSSDATHCALPSRRRSFSAAQAADALDQPRVELAFSDNSSMLNQANKQVDSFDRELDKHQLCIADNRARRAQTHDFQKIQVNKISNFGKEISTLHGLGSPVKEEKRLKRERQLEEARLAARAHQKDVQSKHRPSSCSSADSTPKNTSRRGSEPSRMGLVGGLVAAVRSQPNHLDGNVHTAHFRSSDEKLASRMHGSLGMTATLQPTLLPVAGINDDKSPKSDKTIAVSNSEKTSPVESDSLPLEERCIRELSRLEKTQPPAEMEWSDITRNPYDNDRKSTLELSCDSWQHMTKIGPEKFGSTLALSMSLSGDLSGMPGAQAAF